MSEALAVYKPITPAPIVARKHDSEEIALFAASYAKGCDPTEVKLAVAVAEQLGLSLLSRQIYALKRWDGQQRKEVMQLQVGIDGFRAQADRTGVWAGVDPPRWMDAQGNWTDDWLDLRTPPFAASVTVHRHGFKVPVAAKVYFHERAQFTKDGELTSMWKKKPLTMLGKCAEAEALRKAFPAYLGGVYAPEELPDADVIEGTAEVVKPASTPAVPPPPEQSTRATRTRAKKTEEKPAEAKPASTTAAPPKSEGAAERSAFWSCVLAADGVLDEAGEMDRDATRMAVVRRLRAMEEAEQIPPAPLPLADTSDGLAAWLASYQPAEVVQITEAYRQHATAERAAEDEAPAASPAEDVVEGLFEGVPGGEA